MGIHIKIPDNIEYKGMFTHEHAWYDEIIKSKNVPHAVLNKSMIFVSETVEKAIHMYADTLAFQHMPLNEYLDKVFDAHTDSDVDNLNKMGDVFKAQFEKLEEQQKDIVAMRSMFVGHNPLPDIDVDIESPEK